MFNVKSEVKGFTGNGLQLTGDILQIIIHEDGSLIDGQFPTAGILSEAAVIGDEVSQIFRPGLGSKHDRTMHHRNVLRIIRQISDTVMHREGDIHLVALLPLTTDGYIG